MEIQGTLPKAPTGFMATRNVTAQAVRASSSQGTRQSSARMVNTFSSSNPPTPTMVKHSSVKSDLQNLLATGNVPAYPSGKVSSRSISRSITHQDPKDQSSIQIAFIQLQKQMVSLGFSDWKCIREADVFGGVLFPFACFLRYLLHEGVPDVTMQLMSEYDWFLVEEDDEKLMGSIYRILSERFAYRPTITAAQFCNAASPLAAIGTHVSPQSSTSSLSGAKKVSGSHVAAKIRIVRDCISLFLKAKAALDQDSVRLHDLLRLENNRSERALSSMQPLFLSDVRLEHDRTKLGTALVVRHNTSSDHTTPRKVSTLVTAAINALEYKGAKNNNNFPKLNSQVSDKSQAALLTWQDDRDRFGNRTGQSLVLQDATLVEPAHRDDIPPRHCCRHLSHEVARHNPAEEEAAEQRARLSAMHKALNRVAREPLPR